MLLEVFSNLCGSMMCGSCALFLKDPHALSTIFGYSTNPNTVSQQMGLTRSGILTVCSDRCLSSSLSSGFDTIRKADTSWDQLPLLISAERNF